MSRPVMPKREYTPRFLKHKDLLEDAFLNEPFIRFYRVKLFDLHLNVVLTLSAIIASTTFG